MLCKCSKSSITFLGHQGLSSPTTHFQKMGGGRYRPVSFTYWALLPARLIRILSRSDNDLITQAARLDIDPIIRAFWFDPVIIWRWHSLKRVRCSATCSSLSWLLPPMGMQHACLLLEHIDGSLSRELLRVRLNKCNLLAYAPIIATLVCLLHNF